MNRCLFITVNRLVHFVDQIGFAPSNATKEPTAAGLLVASQPRGLRSFRKISANRSVGFGIKVMAYINISKITMFEIV